MLTQKFWRYGLRIHLSLVILIVISAYLGKVPKMPQGWLIPSDMIGHFVLIGLIAFFLDGVWQFRPLIPGKMLYLRLAPVVILAVAGLEEIAQRFSPRRTSSWEDFLGDVGGVLFFSWCAKYVAHRYGAKLESVTHP